MPAAVLVNHTNCMYATTGHVRAGVWTHLQVGQQVRVSRPYLGCNWLARFGIVEVRGDVKLKQLAKFTYDVLRSPVLVLPLQLVVCLDDFCQLMSQVILRPVTDTRQTCLADPLNPDDRASQGGGQ